MLRPTRALACFTAAAALTAAGCGSAASSGDLDPATLLPAGSLFYADVVVRPEGDQEERMRALAGRLLQTDDPGAKLVDMIERAAADAGEAGSYEKEIEPWLGRRAGAAITAVGGDRDEARGALIAASRDDDAAREQLAASARADKERRGTYKKVTYWVDADGAVTGALEGAVAFASDEAAFKRVVDTAEGGASLAKAKAFSDAVSALPDEREGTLYVDFRSLVKTAIAQSGTDPSSAAIVERLLGTAAPMAAALVAEEDALAIESSTKVPKDAGGMSLFGLPSTGGSALLRELPADAWAAAGFPDLGQSLDGYLKLAAGALGGSVIQQQLEQQYGVDLERDVLSWLGDAAVFIRGEEVAALSGGVTVEVKDPEAAATGLAKLMGLARREGAPVQPTRVAGARMAFELPLDAGEPGPLVIALAQERLVLAYRRGTAEEMLDPERTVEDAGLYDRARDLAEMDPSLFLSFPVVAKFIEAEEAGDPGYAKAKPYLDMIDLVAAGSRREGDRLRGRLAIRLR